jgi:hypothetical protein
LLTIYFFQNSRNQKTWKRKIGDSNTTNFWRHVEVHHPEKDNKKAKKLIEEGQSTLDEFVGQTEVPSKVSVIKLFIILYKFIYATILYFIFSLHKQTFVSFLLNG